MYHKFLVLSALVFTPFIASSSFVDVYATRAERLLGNPTANYKQMEGFSSYGQKSMLRATISAPDAQGDVEIGADLRIDKKSNIAGSGYLKASGTVDMNEGEIDVAGEVVITSGTLYVKPTLTTLPSEFTNEEKVGFQLLDGKWLQVNDTTMPTTTLPMNTTNPIQLGKQLTSLISTTPVLKPTKELTRNGYEIYLVEIDPTGMEQLVAGVITTVAAQVGMPTESPMTLPEPSDFNDLGIKTIGVIGKKGDEIKMGMIMKKDNDPHQVIFKSVSTATEAGIIFRVLDKRTKNSLFNFSLNNNISTLGTQDMQIKFSSPEEKIDISAQITSTAYDGGTEEINAPSGAILLSELMQGK